MMTSLTKSRIWLAIEYHRNQNRGGLFSQRGMFKTWMWERTTISVPPRRPHEPDGIRTHPNFTQCQLYVEVWRTNRLGHSASHFDIKLTLREIGMGSNPTWVIMSPQRKWNSVLLSHSCRADSPQCQTFNFILNIWYFGVLRKMYYIMMKMFHTP